MRRWLSNLDRILRGDATRPDALEGATIQTETGGLMVLIVLLGAIYGLCMGSYSLLKEIPESISDPNGRYLQMLASTVKVPALFYLTLLITFPSLYVFNALVGSRLSIVSVLRLLIASLAVNLAVLASLGPIVLFFSLSTKSYPFILLLNVAVFSVAGALGLSFLLQTLHRLTFARTDIISTPKAVTTEVSTESAESTEPIGSQAAEVEPSALDMPPGQVLGRHTRLVFSCWMVVFALVGAQMGWVLRPFVGSPDLPFSWFRERESNFFEAVLRTLSALFSGSD